MAGGSTSGVGCKAVAGVRQYLDKWYFLGDIPGINALATMFFGLIGLQLILFAISLIFKILFFCAISISVNK